MPLINSLNIQFNGPMHFNANFVSKTIYMNLRGGLTYIPRDQCVFSFGMFTFVYTCPGEEIRKFFFLVSNYLFFIYIVLKPWKVRLFMLTFLCKVWQVVEIVQLINNEIRD